MIRDCILPDTQCHCYSQCVVDLVCVWGSVCVSLSGQNLILASTIPPPKESILVCACVCVSFAKLRVCFCLCVNE